MAGKRKRKPIFDRDGHNVGEVELSSHDPIRSSFWRNLVALTVAFGLGYAANTPTGDRWLDDAWQRLTIDPS